MLGCTDNVVERESTFASLLCKSSMVSRRLAHAVKDRLDSYFKSTQSTSIPLHTAITALQHDFKTFVS
jgi:hypothetical protein